MLQPNDIVTLQNNTIHNIIKVNKKGIGTSLTNDNIILDDIKSFKLKKINKALKFRIYPNKKQIQYFDDAVRTSNFIYNTFLRQQQDISDEFTNKYLNDSKEFNNYLKKYKIELDTEDTLIVSFFKYINESGDIDHMLYYKSLIKDIGVARRKYMKDNDLYFNKYKASKELTVLANSNELNENGILKYGFLKNVDATTRSYTLQNLDNAFTKIWKTHSGYPKFKNRNSTYSFTGQILYNYNGNISPFKIISNGSKFVTINIPKLKKIKMVCHNKLFINMWNDVNVFKLNSYTISKNSQDQYFISIQVITNIENYSIKHTNDKTTIGIDLGVERPITTSNINDFNNPIFANRFDVLLKYAEEKRKLSTILNKKYDYYKKNKTDIDFYLTNSYKRIKHKLGIINTKISNIRNNKQHNITSTLTKNKNNNTFVLEDLNIKNMTIKGSKSKQNFNRVILDIGWNTIKTQLEYKAKELGKEVILIDPAYTSQTCSVCGNIDSNNRTNQSNFKCTKCGHEDNADFNAAINIKNKYINS